MNWLNRPGTHRRQESEQSETGQSMLEMTFGVIFLVLVVLVLFEMAMLFYAYIALVNASREGAVTASLFTEMNQGTPAWDQFVTATSAEAEAAGLVTDPEFFEIDPPIYAFGSCSSNPDDQDVTVQLGYQVMNPTQGIILPLMGRLGLFQSLWVYAHTCMPVRPGAQ